MLWDPEVLSVNISWLFTVLNSNKALLSRNELWSASMSLHLLCHSANETNSVWFKQKMILLNKHWETHPTSSRLYNKQQWLNHTTEIVWWKHYCYLRYALSWEKEYLIFSFTVGEGFSLMWWEFPKHGKGIHVLESQRK